MMFAKSTTGAARTSGKAKGAFGIKNMLNSVAGVAMSGEFDTSAVDIVTKVRNITARIVRERPSNTLSGEYTVAPVGDQTICFGNVWFEIGNGYVFSLHWEFLSGQVRRAVETMVLKDDKQVQDEPVIHHFKASEVDDTYDIYSEFGVLVRYIGEAGYTEEEAQF